MNATAAAIRRSPLDAWMAGRLGLAPSDLSRRAIAAYQFDALRQTLDWARTHSAFYRERLAALDSAPLGDLAGLVRVPFTTPADLVQHGARMLCLPQDRISRIVTLNTSGTTGSAKRVFFTAEDRERALKYFAAGVTAIAAPGQSMLIALPGETEGSVGEQLAQGIARAGIEPIPYGPIHDPAHALGLIETRRIDSIIGFPVQILALARHPDPRLAHALRRMRSIVLCSDHVPQSLVDALHELTGCEIFEHYGSTEMGLGGGVDCAAHAGYHMREADLLLETISPETGEPMAEGEIGEVVVTTLHRTGMPLVRYRTGDLSRLLLERCACGSLVARLERIRARVGAFVPLALSGTLSMAMLDEALFAVPGLLDFRARISLGKPARLTLTVFGHGPAQSKNVVRQHLEAIAAVAAARDRGELEMEIFFSCQPFPVTGAKRILEIVEGA